MEGKLLLHLSQFPRSQSIEDKQRLISKNVSSFVPSSRFKGLLLVPRVSQLLTERVLWIQLFRLIQFDDGTANLVSKPFTYNGGLSVGKGPPTMKRVHGAACGHTVRNFEAQCWGFDCAFHWGGRQRNNLGIDGHRRYSTRRSQDADVISCCCSSNRRIILMVIWTQLLSPVGIFTTGLNFLLVLLNFERWKMFASSGYISLFCLWGEVDIGLPPYS